MSEGMGCNVAASRLPGGAETARGGSSHGRWALLSLALLGALVLAAICAGTAAASAAGGSGFSAGPLVQSAPEAETGPATEVKRTSAVLNATVNPDGLNVTECTFEYGTTESLGSDIQCAYLPGAGESGVPVYTVAEGLEEHTTYYYKIKVKNTDGTVRGALEEFTTKPAAPSVSTEPPSAVTEHTAKLNGVVNPNGAEVTECYFELSTHVRLGAARTVACKSLPGSGEREVPVSAAIEELEKGETYYYRLVAVNAYGVTVGRREVFETPPAAPIVSTGEVVEVKRAGGEVSVTLSGSVNPLGKEITKCEFLYGTTKSHLENAGHAECNHTPAGEEPVRVRATATGLKESKKYYYELVAASEAGEGLGGNNYVYTPPNYPKDDTGTPIDVTATTATLKGHVTPYGALTSCAFEYGPKEEFGKEVACEHEPGSGEESVSVKADVSGLKPETRYNVRLRAHNEFGFAYGGVEFFTTNKEGLAPVITAIKPNKGVAAGGTSVTIKGANFEAVESVSFGGIAAKSFKVDHEGRESEITATSPAHTPGKVAITVTTANGTSAEVKADEYAFEAPTITKITPDKGPMGGDQEVTVEGTGFAVGNANTTFEFGAQKASEVDCSSMTACTLVTPAGTKKGKTKVYATVNGERSKPADYVYES